MTRGGGGILVIGDKRGMHACMLHYNYITLPGTKMPYKQADATLPYVPPTLRCFTSRPML